MKKLFLLLSVLSALVFTGCGDFWDWVEEEADRTYIYSYTTGTLTETEYEYIFEDRHGNSELENKFYPADAAYFDRIASTLVNYDRDYYKLAARWNEIEDSLKNDYGFTNKRTDTIKWRLRNDEKIIYVYQDGVNSYRWFYIYLVQKRDY